MKLGSMTMFDIQIETIVERVLLRPSTKRGEEWAEAQFAENAATGDDAQRVWRF